MKIDVKASDWCTLWPDSWGGYDYSACCQKHDEDYANPDVSRWAADVGLMLCVARNGGRSLKDHAKAVVMAVVMFLGVRCLGWLFRHYVAPQGAK